MLLAAVVGLAAAAAAAAPTQANRFAIYSCDTIGQPTVGGNVFSAIRIAHSKQPGTPKCPSYNASSDPLGPCFTSPAAMKALLDEIPEGKRAISLEGTTMYYLQDEHGTSYFQVAYESYRCGVFLCEITLSV